MSLVWMEGFDFYGDVATLALKYPLGAGTVAASTGTYTLGVGRDGAGKCLCLPRGAAAQFTIQPLAIFDAYVVGFAVRFSGTLGTYPGFVQFQRDGVTHLSLNLQSNGTIVAMAQSPLGTSTNAVVANADYYVEVKFKVSATVGYVEVRVNGTKWVSVPGPANTFNPSSLNPSQTINQATFANLNGTTADLSIDDFYAVAIASPAPSDYLGSVVIQSLLPSGAATGGSGWAATRAASNYLAVNRSPPDASVYVRSALDSASALDLYAFPAVSGANVLGLDFNYLLRREDQAPTSLQLAIQGTGGVGSVLVPATDYGYSVKTLSLDPDTAASWTASGINAHKFGIFRFN